MPAIHSKYSYSLTAVLIMLLTVTRAQVVEYRFEGDTPQLTLPVDGAGMFDDSLILQIHAQLHDRGFLYSETRVLDRTDSLIIVEVRPGSLIRWGNVSSGSLPKSIAREVNFVQTAFIHYRIA